MATLGTATTPVHVQKLFRLTDTRGVLLRRRRRRPQGRVARAREHAAGARRRQERASSCSCPTARIPTTIVRTRGRRVRATQSRRAVPLSEFLLAELAARHPPTSAEGRAALVAAAGPISQIDGAGAGGAAAQAAGRALGPAGTERRGRAGCPRRQPGGAAPAPRRGRSSGAQPAQPSTTPCTRGCSLALLALGLSALSSRRRPRRTPDAAALAALVAACRRGVPRRPRRVAGVQPSAPALLRGAGRPRGNRCLPRAGWRAPLAAPQADDAAAARPMRGGAVCCASNGRRASSSLRSLAQRAERRRRRLEQATELTGPARSGRLERQQARRPRPPAPRKLHVGAPFRPRRDAASC